MTGPSPMPIADLDTPVLLVDRDGLERNIERMRALAAEAGIAYRPHAKAHKCPIIAEMQLAAGAVGICCAKLGEAEVMAAAGIPDILITSEVIGRSKLGRLLAVANQTNLGVVVDDERNVRELAAVAQTSGIRLDVLIEIDVGQGRCGVAPGPEAARLANVIADSPWLRLRGLQGYQGSIQMTRGFGDRTDATRTALDRLLETAALVRSSGHDIEVLTGGGTGTCAIDIAAGGLTELQPGSYIFMDSNYRAIEWDGGGETPFENALTILGTVISRPEPNRVIVDVGFKAASSDGGVLTAVDLPNAVFRFAGDEHGELRFESETSPVDIGDKVTFIPSHCDTTVNLYDHFIVTRGGCVEEVWEIAARGRVQ